MIFDEDWDFLDKEFGPQSARPGTGPGKIIQQIVHRKVLRMKQVKLDALDSKAQTEAYVNVIKEETDV